MGSVEDHIQRRQAEGALRDLVAMQGPGVVADLARLRGMLLDVLGRDAYRCGDQIRALLAAAEAMASADTTPEPEALTSPSIPADIVEELVGTGVDPGDAQWAVDAWGRTLPGDDVVPDSDQGAAHDAAPVDQPSGPTPLPHGSVGEVLPVTLARWGGTAGLDETVTVTRSGDVEVVRGPGHVPVRWRAGVEVVGRLEGDLRRALSSATSLPPPATALADDTHYRLDVAGRSISLVSSGGVPAALAPVVDQLVGLLDAPVPPQSPPPPLPPLPPLPPPPVPSSGRLWVWLAGGFAALVVVIVVGIIVRALPGSDDEPMADPTPTATSPQSDADPTDAPVTPDGAQDMVLFTSGDLVELTTWNDWETRVVGPEHHIVTAPVTSAWTGHLPLFAGAPLVLQPAPRLDLDGHGFALRVIPPTFEAGRRVVHAAEVNDTMIRDILAEFRVPAGCADWSRQAMEVGTLDGWAARLGGFRDVHACDDGSEYVLGGAYNPEFPRFIVLWEWFAPPGFDRSEFDLLGSLVVAGGNVQPLPIPTIPCDPCPPGRRLWLEVLTEHLAVIRPEFCFDTTDAPDMPADGLARIGCELHDGVQVEYIRWANESEMRAYVASFANQDGVQDRSWHRGNPDNIAGRTYEYVNSGNATFFWTYEAELVTARAVTPGRGDQEALNERWRRGLAAERR